MRSCQRSSPSPFKEIDCIYGEVSVRACQENREEIAEISEANRTHMHRRDGAAAADHERRLQRLQKILDELMTLTDWKKP